MSSRKGRNIFRTVSFRLTLWYTLVFTVVTLIVFGLMYHAFIANLKHDISDELEGDIKEFSVLYKHKGTAALGVEINSEARSSGTKKEFFLLLSPDGAILSHSPLGTWPGMDALAFLNVAATRPGRTRTMRFGSRVAMVRIRRLNDGNLLIAGYALDALDRLKARYKDILGLWMLVMLVVGAALGWFITRRAMAGVTRVARTAQRIGSEALDTRVSAGNEGLEVQELAQAFNDMLQRIQAAMDELRRVTDNIAHDLRSPIARIRGFAEMALTGRDNNMGVQDLAARVMEESDRLIGMINDLLDIARTRAGVQVLEKESVDMVGLVADAVDLFIPSAQAKGIVMDVTLPRTPVMVHGDLSRLQRVVANLLDNAIKFTPAGGKVHVTVERSGDEAAIRIRDTGIGIPQSEITKVFNRFYRADTSRSTPGSGLGLSLAQAVVQAHNGRITVTSTPGKGSEFVVVLPCKSP